MAPVRALTRTAGAVRVGLRRLRRARGRVLLLKAWNERLGDLVLMSGTLRHYRRLYADCRLELACADPCLEYFRHCPHLDAAVSLGRLGVAAQRSGADVLRNAGRYDRVISMRRTPNGRDYALLESLRPAWTTGITGDHLLINPAQAAECEARLDCPVPVPAGGPLLHELEVQMRLLKAVGADARSVDDLWPECWTADADAATAERWVSGLDRGKPVIVWAPCGSAPIRDWNVTGFHHVFKSLPECTMVLAGTERDAQFQAGVNWENLGHIRRLDLLGKTSINELVEVVRRSDLVISAEAACFHLAAALRKPAICLAGGGHWGRFVPWGMEDRTRVLTRKLDCFGCGWTCCRPTVECIQEIPPADVARAALELLGRGS